MRLSRRNKVPKEDNTRLGGGALLKEEQSPQGGQYPSRRGMRFSRRNRAPKEDNTRLGGVCVSQGETMSPRRTIPVKDA